MGDVLVIVGTVFFAVSNVVEEFCVKKKDRVEAVTMLGVYGFLVTAIEVSVLELKTLKSIKWSGDIVSGQFSCHFRCLLLLAMVCQASYIAHLLLLF